MKYLRGKWLKSDGKRINIDIKIIDIVESKASILVKSEAKFINKWVAFTLRPDST